MTELKMNIDVRVGFNDGSIPGAPEGYYWQIQTGPDNYGPAHGGFTSEREAQQAAVAFLDEEIRQLYKKSGFPLPP